MKEEGDWSSERRPPLGSTKFDGRSIISGWAALPPELVDGIAGRILSTTGGVDAYMGMRAVCSSWRSAIAKPSPTDAVADLRFRPRHWVMVDLQPENHDGDDDAHLFLHVPTGSFRRLRLPVLRDSDVVGATDGLLVLRDREPPHLARVLNPLTGDMLHFAAPYYIDDYHHSCGDKWYTALSGDSHSTLLLLRGRRYTLEYAHPTSHVFRQIHVRRYLTGMVTFQGNVYYANSYGWVFKLVGAAEQFQHELVAQMSDDSDGALSELVESNGELLLVRISNLAKVFRVDVEHKLLKEAKSLGGCRALFLGWSCVSLDVDKIPSVDSDCIYRSVWAETFGGYSGSVMVTYNLRAETISSEDHHDRPFSLVQVLLQCRNSCSM